MSLRNYYNEVRIKAVIVGVIALFVFGIIANIIDFWLIGMFPIQSFNFSEGMNVDDVVNQGIMKNIPFFLVSSLLTKFIWYMPAGYITAFMAKRAYIYHSFIIGIIGSIFLLYSQIINNVMANSVIFGAFLLFDIFLALSFSIIGGSLCKKMSQASGDVPRQA